MKKNYLIISVNPDPLCIAAEVQIIRSLKMAGNVSAVNLNTVVNNVHIEERIADRVYEFIDNKYSRFIRPELNGIDYTNRIVLTDLFIPRLPNIVSDLREYNIQNVNVGLAALSSAASYGKCISECTIDYGKFLEKSWTVAHKSYFSGLVISSFEIDEVFIFNGRHSISRPIAEVLQKRCKVTYYEFDTNRFGYLLHDQNVYSVETMAASIKNHVTNHVEGKIFFSKNINRSSDATSKSIVGFQHIGLLPRLDETSEVISFFTSSQDEYFAVFGNNFISKDFGNQLDVAVFAAKICAQIQKTLIIRLHPNLQSKHVSWMNEWDFKLLESLGAIIIYPDDKFDSYAILKRSQAVITCGSTVGIEAAYQGIPSGDISSFINSRIGCAIDVSSRPILAKFLKSPTLLENAKEAAIRYGSFVSTARGNEIPGLVKHGDNYLFENRMISPSHFLVSKVKRLLDGFRRS